VMQQAWVIVDVSFDIQHGFIIGLIIRAGWRPRAVALPTVKR
jgi:hypothetical protein